MSGSIIQRVTNFARTPVVAGGSVTVGAAAVAGVGLAAAGVGAGFAISNASDLYRSRLTSASQFQQQLQFPSDLISPTAGEEGRNFFMAFSFMKYEKRSIQNSPFLRSSGTVRLPIPDAIRDNLSISYNTASLTPAVGAGLEAVAGRPSESITSIRPGDLGQVAGGAVLGAIQNLSNQSEVARDTLQATQAYLGLAVNPYQTVLFEKPEFKTHNFSWKIMPRDERESDEARNIFRTFQFHASPGVSEGVGLFFSYPSMVIVSLYPSSEFLYRFKPCIIKSVNVNYAAGNNPSFFKRTNAPTSMTLSIQLQEIEYWTNKDYTADSFNDVEAINRARAIQDRNFLQLQSSRSAATPLGPTGE